MVTLSLNESLKELIKDRIENHGFPLEEYLEKPPAPLKTRFIVIPRIVFALSLLFLCFFQTSSTFMNVLYVMSFSSGTWVCASTQIRFKNGVTTLCVAIGLITTTLLAGGLISPQEAADLVKDMKGK
ncbi:MAG: hypothetical protein HOG03_10425 [Desulfobacula sp.]|jgi:hypothetical protein|uniref:hypothetical protein n=1 Tax=Desulfobacula sp. TaxID=2593537 RepID=UPI001DA17719|nr:hypothetical protein [Desulfobacula sp.]MBT4025488.1 hypothetical protein [Desulfobacula sp.]MBT6340928.1 hypothetical protein [Desulfobacula sp.]MBT6751981.1 hypothetical protein [Desulfobacula sp.]MBT7050582.1 hypothetical protein [Desulfobacula sp.]